MKLYKNEKTTIYTIQFEDEKLSLDMFGLPHHLPTLTLVGDTKYTEAEMIPLKPFFRELAAILTRPNFPVVIVDGATNFGVMKLFGEACEEIKRRPTALIGVTLRTAVEDEGVPFEPHHSHIILTPGEHGEWKTAVPFVQKVRSSIADLEPSALLAIGGGAVTLCHMQEHAQAGIPLYVLLGSGLLPQGFVEAEKASPDPAYPFSLHEHRKLLKTGLVTLLDLSNSQRAIHTLMRALHQPK